MGRDDYRVREDVAGIGPDPSMANRLHRLSESNHYRVASGEPDIRGWEVRTLTGTHLGEVQDLLIDPHRGEVVMLDVDVDNSPDRVNLPIRSVQLDRARRCVLVDSGDMRAAQEALRHESLHNEHDVHDVRDSRADDTRERIRLRSVNDDDRVDDVIDDRLQTPADGKVVEEVVVRRRVVDTNDTP